MIRSNTTRCVFSAMWPHPNTSQAIPGQIKVLRIWSPAGTLPNSLMPASYPHRVSPLRAGNRSCEVIMNKVSFDPCIKSWTHLSSRLAISTTNFISRWRLQPYFCWKHSHNDMLMWNLCHWQRSWPDLAAPESQDNSIVIWTKYGIFFLKEN